MADIELVIKIPEEDFEIMKHNVAVNNPLCPLSQEEMVAIVADGTPLSNKVSGVEPLTDTEQRIFLAAMGREEKICKEVCADGDEVDLVETCHNIKRKVKTVLWK